jgi:hypothetical protein
LTGEKKEAKSVKNMAHRSFHSLPFSNGYTVGIYDAKNREINFFSDCIYWYRDASTKQKNLLKKAYFGIEQNGRVKWLKDFREKEICYLKQSGIVFVSHKIDGKEIECYYFTPFTRGKHAIVMIARIRNAEGARIEDKIDLVKGENVGIKKFDEIIGEDFWHAVVLSLPDEFEFLGSPINLLEEELGFWEEWHRIEPEVNDPYKELYKQSTTLIKMAQCREEGKGRGQILAGLPLNKKPNRLKPFRRSKTSTSILFERKHRPF